MNKAMFLLSVLIVFLLVAPPDPAGVEAAAPQDVMAGYWVLTFEDGRTGWLVESSSAAAAACCEILDGPEEARARALRGKEHVRRSFLTPRLLRDWLVLFNRLEGNDTAGAELRTAVPA